MIVNALSYDTHYHEYACLHMVCSQTTTTFFKI